MATTPSPELWPDHLTDADILANRDVLFRFVPYDAKRADDIPEKGSSYWQSVWESFRSNKAVMVLCVIFLLLVVMSFVCPYIGKYRVDDLVPETELAFLSPCREFWFGTDNLGRDYWCQVWYASRISISLALIVAVCSVFLGVVLGLVWGYLKKLDSLFMLIYNVFDNVPSVIYLTLISMVVGKGFWIMALTLTVLDSFGVAMGIRNMVMVYRDREFNVASRCLGTPVYRILIRNIFPQLISVVLLEVALTIPATIAMESTLSFLGLGLDINTPSLGILLKNARLYYIDYPYLMFFPAIIVSLITTTFYLVGNAFADASDPKNHR